MPHSDKERTSKQQRDAIEREREAFRSFLEHEQPSLHDIEAAYAWLLGEGEDMRELSEAGALVAIEMRARVVAGFPREEFVSVIDAVREGTFSHGPLEVAPEQLNALVGALPIAEEEKELLRSVVRESRAGTITVEEAADEEFIGSHIVHLNFDADDRTSLVSLYQLLLRLRERSQSGSRFTFTFQSER
jgi:hypothetical protein